MREILEKGLTETGLGTSCIPALEEFSRLLLEKNKVMNLTAITEPADVARLHLLDSLCLLGSVGSGGKLGKSVVDVGTGAGFPGMPLAIAVPEIEVTLLDSLGKRIAFLEEAAGALGLKNVSCVQARAEEFAGKHRESFDTAVSRAVAALPMLCELCLPLVKVGGCFVAMKSSHTEEEIKESEQAIRVLGGRLADVENYRIPTTDVLHRLVKVEKVSPTPRKYPRRFALIKKQPL